MRSGPADGARNMALDEALLLEVRTQPLLRFYSWEPYCLSLGYGQRCRVVDEARLRARGYTLVRRPSGGGAILHARELTWSLVLPAGHPLAAGSLRSGYRRVAGALLRALRSLDVPVTVQPEAKGGPSGAVCFGEAAPSELAVRGRKLLGSARVQRRGGSLQHGSLPLEGDIAAICELMHYIDETARARAAARLRERATTLARVCGSASPGREQVMAAIVDAFRTVFDVDFLEAEPTPQEELQAMTLESTRYGNPAWVRRR